MGLEIDCTASPLDGCPLTVIWEVSTQPILISNGFESAFIVSVTSSFKLSMKSKPDVMVLDIKSVQGR